MELALIINKIVGYEGKLLFNDDYTDGMARKFLDISRINRLGWKSKIILKNGIEQTYKWYVENYE